MIRIVPRTNMVVIDPVTSKAIPSEGIEVLELDSYWIRRRNDGDVVATDPFDEAVRKAKGNRG